MSIERCARVNIFIVTFYLLFVLPITAKAYTIYDVTDMNGNPSIAWQEGTTNNDTRNPFLQVNTDKMFDAFDWSDDAFIDWVFLQKNAGNSDGSGTDIELGQGVINIQLEVGFNDNSLWDSTSGTWSIRDDAWSYYDQFMIVMKTGGQGSDLNYVGYLLDYTLMPTSGKWDSSNFDNRALSHMSIYGRTNEYYHTPEPATFMLFGLGLIGVAGLGRRKKT